MMIDLSGQELAFLLYALRRKPFEDDLKGCQERAEALKKKLVDVTKEFIGGSDTIQQREIPRRIAWKID